MQDVGHRAESVAVYRRRLEANQVGVVKIIGIRQRRPSVSRREEHDAV
jgi:hypothetical protein